MVEKRIPQTRINPLKSGKRKEQSFSFSAFLFSAIQTFQFNLNFDTVSLFHS
ncbi:hypothetical protein AQPE_3805 [Aquipluma nitroreducens]|uniref:Uncharacterized protein n=1 Tax=Aquipluma nitroreducens TaxID=2010828 RepID=A0A5K7SDQ2_9BACT|nr:hypothetical protein AQPE_3805 [Aquipluma nitroreducens]